ncbi:MAG: site-specific DNA-methyltransferase [Desulfococcaceae bacterium]|nr:site-specific DNA-methyltransferase [Desulfococcaceae bacterium]
MIILPVHPENERQNSSGLPDKTVNGIIESLGPDATLITIGDVIGLVHSHKVLSALQYHLWISIKRKTVRYSPDNSFLPHCHFGALVHTKYKGSLQHTLTRIQYTYCPSCKKTSKDYGGKKHTYNSYGTLISDVWRDICCDPDKDLSPVFRRFSDLFGLEFYNELRVMDCRSLLPEPEKQSLKNPSPQYSVQAGFQNVFMDKIRSQSRLIQGDCIGKMRNIQDDSVDFAFADPPYNLGKKYNNYADDLSVREYFSWCDQWIKELARILRPGRTLALLNIPLWAIRHFLYLETVLEFQNWISWEALSFPVRKIMPAHYAILCFSKGKPRPLPGFSGTSGTFDIPGSSGTFLPLEPLAEWYCLRAGCVKKRNSDAMTDRGQLTDLWWDIHRLKHNSRRVDHPCQVPPQLMYRLISVFTQPGETVLDCFNGAGTSTLAAHQCGRKYIGIELSEKYHDISRIRHEEICRGIDPFRKSNRELTEKNSPVARLPKKKYEIPKKTLQLEVRRVARQLGCLPKREDIIKLGKYPIKYYDEYFFSWGEVCAAARHEGMSETSKEDPVFQKSEKKSGQIGLFSE